MAWQTPVFDRTAADAAEARRIHGLIRSVGWDALPSSDKAVWNGTMKGRWQPEDYLRAVGNLTYLADALTAYGYPITLQAMPEVTGASLGWRSYVQALTDNAAVVRGALTVMGTTPAVPAPVDPWNYSKVNDLERILLDVEQLITNMAARFRPAGTFAAGQANILPRSVM